MYKHERITIVVLSYIIGFSTAFIAFNFVAPNPATTEVVIQNARTNQETTNKVTEKSSLATAIEEKADGLYALINGQSRILSAQAISGVQGQQEGFHYATHAVTVAPSGDFIHYCVQETENSDSCKHYIYELASDSVHRVSLPTGEQLSSDISEIFIEWLPGDVLTTSDYLSANSQAPWELFAKP